MDRPAHYRSLREHIEVLRGLNELHEIDREVDWNLEIGAITRRLCETGGPAVLFNHIKGAKGFRALGAPAGASARADRPLARAATSIGLPPGAMAWRSSMRWRGRMTANPFRLRASRRPRARRTSSKERPST